ncbi:RsmF rRNA methyltransferase first C-terminal domain-containing protein [Ectobacillus polymachus]|uniref:RsmF rRNA methyltransferase first C-terminal domain-containing protein n=1 Tax=Ectobacillus polymachus TaxID=1508806 RepID=UPI003A83B40C
MDLPKDFLDKMKDLLKEEYDDFIKSYEDKKSQGLRVNTLKVSIDEFTQKTPFTIEKIPWVQEGFFYSENDRPGKHPYHDAGVYYMQEPSAMAVGELLDPHPGEKILDLCAAPGGKTTHIAARMQGQGFLLTNEIHPARAKILSQNIERMGVSNAVVTNETPARLAERFPAYFDRIMVDAPCSGEGMFRKDPIARQEWSLENVMHCSVRQSEILEHAGNMLKPGGRLVYSTCTFAPEENEGTISKFIHENPNFKIETVHMYEGFSNGQAGWIPEAAANIENTIRLWPHRMRGEGHYIAVLQKTDGDEPAKRNYPKTIRDTKQLKEYTHFVEETLLQAPKGEYILFGEQLYCLPKEMLSFDKLKVVRPGLHLGTMKKNRFEPAHALALMLKNEQVKYSYNRTNDEIMAYLKGEALQAEGPKGWYLVEVDGYSIGWGKLAGGVLKNHYPKGLRWTGK